MSFLRMSQVGYLPADQKLKRGEIVLQYTKVLEQPDYTPIPFNKQVVKTIKADLTWSFTKLMKKIHKHDGAKAPIHVREILHAVDQEAKKKRDELEVAKKLFKDRFTGVKGLSRFGHDTSKKMDHSEIGSDLSDYDNDHDPQTDGEMAQSEYDHEDDHEDDNGQFVPPPPPPSPPDVPPPENGGEDEPGSPDPPHVAMPIDEEAVPPVDVTSVTDAASSDDSTVYSPTDNPYRLAPGHQVLANVTAGVDASSSSSSLPPRHRGDSRRSSGVITDGIGQLPISEPIRRKSWVQHASDAQHHMAAMIRARGESMDKTASAEEETAAASAQVDAASSSSIGDPSTIPHAISRPVSGVPSQQQQVAAIVSRPPSSVGGGIVSSRPPSAATAASPVPPSQSPSRQSSRPTSARPIADPTNVSVPPSPSSKSSSRPIGELQQQPPTSSPSPSPQSQLQPPSSSRPTSAVQSSSAAGDRVLGSRPTSAVRPLSASQNASPAPVLGSRPTSAASGVGSSSRPVSRSGSRIVQLANYPSLSRPQSAARVLSRPETRNENDLLEKKEDELSTRIDVRDEDEVEAGDDDMKHPNQPDGSDPHLLPDSGDFHDFAAIRASQAANPDGGFLKPSSPLHEQDEDIDLNAPAIIVGKVTVDDDEEDEHQHDESDVVENIPREGPRPYGFLPFIKISRNGFTKEIRIPGFGDKHIDPPLGWLREKYRFAAPTGVQAFTTLHAYGYVVYAKNNIRF